MESQFADLQRDRIVGYECHILLRGGGFDLYSKNRAQSVTAMPA